MNPNYIWEDKRKFRPSDYEGQNCGYDSAISHEEIRKYGFVSFDGTDTVTVRLAVRRENYF